MFDEFDNEKFIYIGEDDVKYCYDNCKNDQVVYIKSENEKYCLSSCLNSNENLYLDKDRKHVIKIVQKLVILKYMYMNMSVFQNVQNIIMLIQIIFVLVKIMKAKYLY